MTAVVIPYYRGEKYLERCVSSILDQSGPELSIFIADNDPTGYSSSDPRVEVVKCVHNIGFGRAVNAGVYTAIEKGYSNIIVSNQDVIFEPSSIGALVAQLHPNTIRVVVPMINEYGGNQFEPHFVQRVLSNSDYKKYSSTGEVPDAIDVPVASAACFAMRAEVISQCGLFDPVFHMYGEDDDLFHRIHRSGGKIVLATHAHIQHFHSLTNASPAQKRKIAKQQATSLDILKIRSLKTKSPYWEYSIKELTKALLHGGASALEFQLQMRASHLNKWSSLNDGSTQAVKRRISQSLRSDIING